MTQRERQASGGGSEAAFRSVPGSPAMLPEGVTGDGTEARLPLWEHLFFTAAPEQQAEWLRLAREQGVLYAHQLAAANGVGTDRPRQVLAHVLQGDLVPLDPSSWHPDDFHDTALDENQRAAVTRALHTPDICLIQGLPGTGKSRVAREIIVQAARRGERVLVLAPHAASLRYLCERLATCPDVFAVRCLEREERLADLSPVEASLTFAERLRHIQEQSLLQTRRQIIDLEQLQHRWDRDEPLWSILEELATRWQHLEGEARRLTKQRDAVALEIQHETEPALAGTPHDRLAELCCRAKQHDETVQRLDCALAALQERLSKCQQELAQVESQLEALQPLVTAKEQGCWWTLAWWRATLRGIPARHASIAEQRRQLLREKAELEAENLCLSGERQQANAVFAADRDRLINAEVTRRQSHIDHQLAALRQEQQIVQEKWHQRLVELAPRAPRPATCAPRAVAEARIAWQALRERFEQDRLFAHDWAECLEQLRASLPQRLLQYMNVVLATPRGWESDEHFNSENSHFREFDWLILEDAQLISEAEFLHVARWARRWVLVGEPTRHQDTTEPANGEHAAGKGKSASPSSADNSAPPVSFFQRLWDQLHCDPSRWPYTWVQENDCLRCQLAPFLPEQRPWIECEPLVDRPEIELHILTLPRTEPRLVEVVFPPSMTIGEAKEFLFQELEELPVQAAGHALSWCAEEQRLVLRLSDTPGSRGSAVALAPGVRELVGSIRERSEARHPSVTYWRTFGLEFDRAAGWTRDAAEEWARRHLPIRDWGRTAWLPVPHRMRFPLAAIVSDLLYNGSYRWPVETSALDADTPTPVEFVPVPPPDKEPSHRPGRANDRKRPDRGGAGLECHLANPRHVERLPREWRACLPAQGIVNYAEAQAVVRMLEELARNGDISLTSLADASVGVLALYPAQVELIRALIGQSPLLRDTGLEHHVAIPQETRQREYRTVLVSLTRSHTHRAVSFGTDPNALPLALTRTRDKLILFGDPGTLIRRGQWHGALDHLDDAAATRERDLIQRLVRYLHGQGLYSQAFQLRAGVCA
ncbi:MAG: AAA domain-containing protein [Gemmataceae bacterium]